MNKYTSCFVGIPLPDKYQIEFDKILKDIRALDSGFKTVHPKTPHVTVYYLDRQSQADLESVASDVKKHIHLLKDVSLTVKGLDTFGNRVLYLKVVCPPAFEAFNRSLSTELSHYRAAGNNHAFHPHLTLARVRTQRAQEAFLAQEKQVKKLVSKVQWNFELREVVIYGVDSTKEPEHHQKLISLSI